MHRAPRQGHPGLEDTQGVMDAEPSGVCRGGNSFNFLLSNVRPQCVWRIENEAILTQVTATCSHPRKYAVLPLLSLLAMLFRASGC